MITLQIKHPTCVKYLCDSSLTNTEAAERALCRRLGITVRKFRNSRSTKRRSVTGNTIIPVKIADPRLVDFVIFQKQRCGISHRHTVESALLDVIEKGDIS